MVETPPNDAMKNMSEYDEKRCQQVLDKKGLQIVESRKGLLIVERMKGELYDRVQVRRSGNEICGYHLEQRAFAIR